jgi:hypothetical protein
MTKAPEEGKIWEWRAFGQINDRLAAQVTAHPIRLSVSNVRGRDVYFISPTSDQNVKFRPSESGIYLKFKRLLEKRANAFELYYESAQQTFGFPIHRVILKEAARLLETTLPDSINAQEIFTEAEMTHALALATPPIPRIEINKVRSQYRVNHGWIEMAEVEYNGQRTQTVSLHAEHIETVEEMLSQLELNEELEPMNYVERCRRWLTP